MLLVDHYLAPSFQRLLYADDYNNWLYCCFPDVHCPITLPQYFQMVQELLEKKQYQTCILDFSFGPQATRPAVILAAIEEQLLPEVVKGGLEYLVLLSSFSRLPQSMQKKSIDAWEKVNLQVGLFGQIMPAIRWMGDTRQKQKLRQLI